MSDHLAPLRKAPGIVRLHGHRAARGILPENTMMAFQHVFDTGVQVVELDVLSTADGVPVITHNPRLMAASTRGPDGQWLAGEGPRIYDLTFEELQRYDIGGLRAGTDYANRYPDQAFLTGQTVPKLTDLAEMVNQPSYDGVWLNLEVKSHPDEPENTPPLMEYTASIVDVLEQHDLLNRVIFQSFDWRILSCAKNIAPDLPRSHLSYEAKPNAPMDANILDGSDWMAGASRADHGGSLPRLIAAMGGSVWSPYFADIRADEVALAQELGLIVNAWTANEIADVQAAIDAGVDGIITDYPGRVQRQLLAQGLSWREDFRPFAQAG
ncbi:glycerophosphodiester phosphodiesterase family protein [uncultured Pelagimonas sp.]|uniref:glycerophosphodiester phosphodiesterase family protein n=1 Tax=uncultured Pelagimonas sp. TaxID=1618102 RepID=UPI002618290D|nr:glycerophosphodiester phosphodiesterase family protein [uncultured Pelagimonas sp.]